MTKSDGLAGFLSFVVPGLGQIYNGHYVKGILFFLVPLILWNVAYMFYPTEVIFGRGLFHEYLFATIVAFIIRILAAREASRSAKAINFGEETGDISISQIKSKGIKGILLNTKTILFILFVVFMVWGFSSTSNTDFGDYGYIAEGSIVATNSSYELVNYEAAEDDHFIADREDSQYYYGHWGGGHDASFDYEEKWSVNLSDIKWNITLNDANNKNMNDSVALADIKENITGMIVTANKTNDITCNNGYLGSEFTLEGDTLSYYNSWTQSDVLNQSGDITYTFHLTIKEDSDFANVKVITFNVTIPSKNIHLESPDVKMESEKNYNVEKRY